MNQNNAPRFDATAAAPMQARGYVNSNENFQNPEMYNRRGKLVKLLSNLIM